MAPTITGSPATVSTVDTPDELLTPTVPSDPPVSAARVCEACSQGPPRPRPARVTAMLCGRCTGALPLVDLTPQEREAYQQQRDLDRWPLTGNPDSPLRRLVPPTLYEVTCSAAELVALTEYICLV